MSLLAGFDLVAEISNAALLKVLKTSFQVSGTFLNPPFQMTIPLSRGQGSLVDGQAFVVVTDVQIDLNANDSVSVTMDFSNSAVATNAPITVLVDGLDGNFVIKAPIILMNVSSQQQAIGLDIAAAQLALNFSQASQNKITAATGLPAALLIGLATSAITTYFQSLGTQQVPFTFAVVPNSDGSLAPLRFERLEVHCIPDQNRNNQALGLFAILLAANDRNGDHTQKTSTAITAGNDICISISPGAFHSIVFCPSIRDQLGAQQVGNLPRTCGSAGGFDIHDPVDATITDMADSFGAGFISITVDVTKSGFCYDANGHFQAQVGVSVNGSVASAFLTAPLQQQINVDIPWYCWLAAGLIGGPIGLAVTAAINSALGSIANNLEQSLQQLVAHFAGITTQSPNFGLASFNTATITNEGLTIQGTVSVSVPDSSLPEFELIGSVEVSNTQQVGAGTFTDTSFCKLGDFPFTEYSQTQVGTYEAVYFGKPHVISFWLADPNNPGNHIQLAGSSGNATVPGIDVQFPFPLPGGTAVTQAVHVGYRISGGLIQVTNNPAEGNFALKLGANFTLYWPRFGVWKPMVFEATATVQFSGDVVVIGNDYASKLSRCIRTLISKLGEVAFVRNPLVWVPVNYPPPEEILDFVLAVFKTGTPENEALIPLMKLVHGTSFLRALSSGASLQAGITKERLTATPKGLLE